jgi:hypothetical protein
MKKLKKKKRSAKSKQTKPLKMSEMIINYAMDYIRLGDSIDQKQSYLNGACSAWNISLLPAEKRKEAIDQFISQYKAINPDADDVENVRHDMELLIKEKLKLYPDEKRAIAKAKFVEEAGKERILVASIGKIIKHL